MPRVAVLVGVLVFAFVAVGGLAAQYESAVTGSQPQQTIENETFTVNTGATHAFNESRRDVVYNGSAAVYQNNTEFDAAGNYTWHPGNGTLSVPSGSGLTDGDDATITYQFTEPTGAQRMNRDIALLPFELGEGLGIIVGAVLLLTSIALLARQR